MKLNVNQFRSLVAEVVDEAGMTGLSVDEALSRLLAKGLRELEANQPKLHASVCRHAARQGIPVQEFIRHTIPAAYYQRIGRQAQLVVQRLRQYSPYGFDLLLPQ